jgi:hypothetical protein
MRDLALKIVQNRRHRPERNAQIIHCRLLARVYVPLEIVIKGLPRSKSSHSWLSC